MLVSCLFIKDLTFIMPFSATCACSSLHVKSKCLDVSSLSSRKDPVAIQDKLLLLCGKKKNTAINAHQSFESHTWRDFVTAKITKEETVTKPQNITSLEIQAMM